MIGRILPFLLSALAVALPAPAAEVTPERLANAAAEPQNWLMNLGSHAGHRYSALSAINRDTVGTLVPRYHVQLGGTFDGGGNYLAALPLSPLVEDGYIYVVDGWGSVIKLDARKEGAIVWQSKAGQNDLDSWLQATRGIALHRDSVISASADGKLHWIDRATGKVTRSVQLGNPDEGYSIAAPPLVVGDRIIVGGGGPDRTFPGRIDAVDALTGEPLWQVDAPAGTGADFLQSGVYDAETGLTIWSAGNPKPRFDTDGRPDETGFTNSAIAIDVETGEVRWRFPFTPGGTRGFSEAGSQQLVPGEGGSTILAHFGNNGFFYALDAASGKLLQAVPHAEGIEWAAGIGDAGQPIDAAAAPADWVETPGCPNVRSVPAFASAYSPDTGFAYGAGADGCLPALTGIKTESAPGWHGAFYAGAANAVGSLSAIDPVTGSVAAHRVFDFPLHSGVLATGGGLVFTTTAEGTLHALDDRTLEPVWSEKFATLSPVPPFTFEVDGEQFIGVVVGGNSLAASLSYRPPEMGITESLYVLVILGEPS
jgi:alcohol dehydrogenase (cytochrome c)